MARASQVASSDLKKRLTLMRTSPSVWVQAVRHVTADAIEELTFSANSPARPFGHGFLFPRRTTVQVLQEPSKSTKLLGDVDGRADQLV
jgi:hypothetical protein